MKKNIIVSIIFISIIILLTIVTKLNTSKNTIEEQGILENETTFSDESEDLSKRVMLADILNFKDEILVTEDNIDNTQKIINNANLHNGIFVEEKSRERFKEILNVTLNSSIYEIDNAGYLYVINNFSNNSHGIQNKIDSFLNEPNKTKIIKITDTYMERTDGMMLEFFIEPECYIESHQYNENISIFLINPEKLIKENIENPINEIYEEILLNIFD